MQFGSDNQVGASRQVLDAVVAANDGHVHSYGNDPYSERAIESLKETFGCELSAFFVSTGTASNALALSCLAQPWEIILCHDHSHILNDESTAPEFFSHGSRLVGISKGDGKLEPRHLREYFALAGTEYPHNSRAAALNITQASENGLVYSADELRALADIAHEKKLKVQMDGARFANAVAALGCKPADLSWKSGVDVLCLGATKNGALAAEVVIFFDAALAASFVHRRKRSGHLLSKNRFAGAQLAAWLKDGHWLELAAHANKQASALAERLNKIDGIKTTWPVRANEAFVILPKRIAERLRAAGAEFYEWPLTGLPPGVKLNNDQAYIRLVTSFVTTDDEVARFCEIAGRKD